MSHICITSNSFPAELVYCICSTELLYQLEHTYLQPSQKGVIYKCILNIYYPPYENVNEKFTLSNLYLNNLTKTILYLQFNANKKE